MLRVTEVIKLQTTLSVAFDDYGPGICLGESFGSPHRAIPRLWINAWRSRLHRPPLQRPPPAIVHCLHPRTYAYNSRIIYEKHHLCNHLCRCPCCCHCLLFLGALEALCPTSLEGCFLRNGAIQIDVPFARRGQYSILPSDKAWMINTG